MSPAPLQTVLRSCFWPAGVFVRAALPAGVQGVFTQQSHEVDRRGCSSSMFHWIHGHHWLFGLVAWFSLWVREVLGSIPRTALLPVWFHGAARANHPAPDLQCIRLPPKPLCTRTTPLGFEPTRGDPIGLAGRRLSRSAKVSSAKGGNCWAHLFC